ncbi:hypothetical protein DL98DRAFT_540515 [Cadophora sp. DSE1049]|nr:hypothetical protein DL98DRAFT_540515 [Cadophora sp. DSE1049]
MGPTDWNALRAANLASDGELRQRARVDTDLHTGVGITSSFATATHGEKLRTSAEHREAYQKDDQECRLLVEMVTVDLAKCSEAEVEKKAGLQLRIDWACHRIAQIKEMLKMIDELEQLVLDEAKPDWDWKAGIGAQLEIRKSQHTLQQLMVPEPGQGESR